MTTGAPAFLARYDATLGRLPGDSALRAAAAAAFRSAGLPGGTQQRRIEAWKFTSLRPIAETPFRQDTAPRHEAETILSGLPLLDAPRSVFVDGTLRADLSTMPASGFARFAEQPDFGTLSWPDREPMVALNTMLAADGAALHVPSGHDGGTVQLVSIATADADNHPRHSICLGNDAKLTLVEVSAGQGTYLLNTVAEIHVAPGAHLTHIRLQDEAQTAFHISTTYADVEAGATYDSFTLNLGARLARTEVHAQLTGTKATAHLNAAQILAGTQHSDFTTVVSHAAPNCTSRQTVKNVL
ncbi:MAG TPA: SufD family Fe-S cluster assembly protein, partial [Rhodopila sp.]|nr:SufD family Fe-S cluster assembly protein [Rhodopila sp.]